MGSQSSEENWNFQYSQPDRLTAMLHTNNELNLSTQNSGQEPMDFCLSDKNEAIFLLKRF